MIVLVISDIHANLTALETVLADAGAVDAVWCLGDVVGYGPDPNECIQRVRSLPNLACLMGNHDAAALDQIDVEAFNTDARISLQWMREALSAENKDFLKRLPERLILDQVTLAHGSPRNPIWEYILDGRIARPNFDFFTTLYCMVGHTHIPVLYQTTSKSPGIKMTIPDVEQRIPFATRAIANPGSVGQPRDRDPRAAYALFDTELHVWEQRRVAYDIAAVQKRILAAGLPERHAIRLAEGW